MVGLSGTPTTSQSSCSITGEHITILPWPYKWPFGFHNGPYYEKRKSPTLWRLHQFLCLVKPVRVRSITKIGLVLNSYLVRPYFDNASCSSKNSYCSWFELRTCQAIQLASCFSCGWYMMNGYVSTCLHLYRIYVVFLKKDSLNFCSYY
jgi:hypothetical protein